MKYLEKLLITNTLFFVFVFALPYFMLQTTWGASVVSQCVSRFTPYTITIGQLSHAPSSFFNLTLSDVNVKHKTTQQPILSAKQLHVTFNPRAPFSLNQLRRIYIDKGSIAVNQLAYFSALNLGATQLQLHNSTLSGQHKTVSWQAKNINGGINAFSLPQLFRLEHDQHFQFTLGEITVADVIMKDTLIRGNIQSETLFLDNIGSNINGGQFTARARFNKTEQLVVTKLRVNQLQLQTAQDLLADNALSFVNSLPALTIESTEITRSGIESPSIKATAINSKISAFSWDRRRWSADNGEWLFNADNVVLRNHLFTAPNIELSLQKDHTLTINHFSTQWNDGFIRAKGELSDTSLHLSQLRLSQLHYSLPENWLSYVYPPLPGKINTIKIDQLTLTPSLFVDTNAKFSSQYTNLQLQGSDIVYQTQPLPHYSQGHLSISVDNATVNTIPITHLNAELHVNPAALFDVKATALVAYAPWRATLTMAQTAEPAISLLFTIANADLTSLQRWRLIKNPPHHVDFAEINLNGLLKATPQLHGDITLKQSAKSPLRLLVNQGLIATQHH